MQPSCAEQRQGRLCPVVFVAELSVPRCLHANYDGAVLALFELGQFAWTMIVITNAFERGDIEVARQMFREYQESLGVDLSFQNFAAELDALPGSYASPHGRLLLAREADRVMGCAALRPLTAASCEMKRLYVRPEYRTLGLGRQMVARLIDEARLIGYSQMFLDTLPTMTGAQRMYERFGFKDVPPYRHNPIEGTRFLGLDL
jgi:putative acetyltransferase